MNRIMNWILGSLRCIDWPLLLILALLSGLGMTVMHSAVGDTDWRFADQGRKIGRASCRERV